MDVPTHIAHVRIDTAALLDAYRTDPTAPVPSCPGWDRTALLTHVAGAHAWIRTQLALGPSERVRLSTIERPPDGDALPAWYEAGAADLIHRLETMDTSATWPTWAGPQPGTFFPRRMAQENAVHRWDADRTPIDPDLAVDGVDELLELFAPRLPADVLGGATGTIHLHATDVEDTAGEWLIGLTRDGIRSEHGHAKGDVAVRGRAGDLLLWTWNRVPPTDDRFQVFGDPSLLDVWRTSVTF
ncbi:MAG: maleylpyruvate isomerase family mycothiol-dependent enzyme [Acidimicrobiales bacterium]